MKRVHEVALAAIWVILVFNFSCQKEKSPTWPDTTFPVVQVTSNNYCEAEIIGMTPHSELFEAFCESYVNQYSDALKAEVVKQMKIKAFRLGEDPRQLEECMEATGHLAPGVISLPYYAERACYDDQDMWLIEFAWGYAAADLAHFKSFVMGISTCDTIYYVSCL